MEYDFYMKTISAGKRAYRQEETTTNLWLWLFFSSQKYATNVIASVDV